MRGEVVADGKRWRWEDGSDATPIAVMAPALEELTFSRTDEWCDEFIGPASAHGFTCAHLMFNGPRHGTHALAGGVDDPQLNTGLLDRLIYFAGAVYDRGGSTWGWWWGDEDSNWAPKDPLSGNVRRYNRTLAAELGPVLGLLLGYCFDGWEGRHSWTRPRGLEAWFNDLQEAFLRQDGGHHHLLGARGGRGKTGEIDQLWRGPAPWWFYSYEQWAPTWADLLAILEDAGGPAASADRFRQRANMRSKDRTVAQQLLLVEALLRLGIGGIFGNLGLRSSPEGSLLYPDPAAFKRLIWKRESGPDPSLPELDEIEVLFPGTEGIFAWPAIQELPITATRAGDELRFRWPNVSGQDWPDLEVGPSGSLHFGNLWGIYRRGDRWVAEPLEWLRRPHEETGTRISVEKFDAPPAAGPVGFFIAGPSRHTPDREHYRRRTAPVWLSWWSLDPWITPEPEPPVSLHRDRFIQSLYDADFRFNRGRELQEQAAAAVNDGNEELAAEFEEAAEEKFKAGRQMLGQAWDLVHGRNNA